MDVMETEREKTILRLSVDIARKKFGKRASVDSIHNELANHKSQTVQKIFQIISIIHDSIPEQLTWQRLMVSELGEFAIWCFLHHPVYSRILANMSRTMFDERISFDDNEWMFSKVDIYLSSLILKYVYKKLHEKQHFVENKDFITIFSNPAAKHIYLKICNAIEKSNTKHCDELKLLSGMLLWLVTHDTAYHDMFYWGMYTLGNTEIKKLTAMYYLPPNKWHVTNYQKANDLTKKMYEKGMITQYEKSLPSKYCVHSYRNNQIQTIINRSKKRA
jgi:hypothetical protein